MAKRDEVLAAARLARPSRCMFFVGRLNPDGYGKMFVPGKGPVSVHRFVASKLIGPVAGREVRHTCDFRSCYNPHHLRIGTHLDNMHDAWSKLRMSKKLSLRDVTRIHALRLKGWTQERLGKKFGVRQSTISRILNGVRWKGAA